MNIIVCVLRSIHFFHSDFACGIPHREWVMAHKGWHTYLTLYGQHVHQSAARLANVQNSAQQLAL